MALNVQLKSYESSLLANVAGEVFNVLSLIEFGTGQVEGTTTYGV